MAQDRFHSPTRSAASISPTGDQMSDVTTRADDRWARLTLMLWSQHEEDWRERVKSGKMINTIKPSTCTHPTSARQKGANQYARWENCTKCQQRLSTEKRDYWKEAKVLRQKALEKEEMARRMEEQKNRAFRSAPRRPRTRVRVPTLEQMNDQLRNDQPNKNETELGPTSRTPTVAASSSTNNHLEEVLKGTGTTGRVSATHVGAAITDAASSSTASVCSDGSHSTARGNTTSSNSVDIRGDAAKDLVRVVRDGSTPEGRRLREQLWVWLHLQDEEATEPVPKQLQSWLTGQRTQQRKEFKRNRRRHSSQTDLIEIFSAPRIITHAVRQGLRTTTPTNLDVTENWDATTVTGRDKLETS